MRREDPQPWERSCPVLHGPRAQDFWRGYGWLFLLASLAIHAALLLLLPAPLRVLLTPQQDILLQLKEPPPPPPPPSPPPEPEPQPQAKPQPPPIAEPEQKPDPEPREQPEPGPVIGVPGDGPSAIQSGETMPEFPAAKPEPDPPAEPQEQPPPLPKPVPEIDVNALLLEYAGAVKAQVLQRKYYPAIAERLGHAGAVKVGFTILADGQLADVRIKSGSGWDELDEAAVDAVRSAAPFDAIPEETEHDELSLSITLKYTLD